MVQLHEHVSTVVHDSFHGVEEAHRCIHMYLLYFFARVCILIYCMTMCVYVYLHVDMWMHMYVCIYVHMYVHIQYGGAREDHAIDWL